MQIKCGLTLDVSEENRNLQKLALTRKAAEFCQWILFFKYWDFLITINPRHRSHSFSSLSLQNFFLVHTTESYLDLDLTVQFRKGSFLLITSLLFEESLCSMLCSAHSKNLLLCIQKRLRTYRETP